MNSGISYPSLILQYTTIGMFVARDAVSFSAPHSGPSINVSVIVKKPRKNSNIAANPAIMYLNKL